MGGHRSHAEVHNPGTHPVLQEIQGGLGDPEIHVTKHSKIGAATTRVIAALLSAIAIAGALAVAPAPAAAPASSPPRPPVVPQVVFDGLGPLAWNATLDRNRGAGSGIPRWLALRVLAPLGSESLFVFPGRGPSPMLVGSWPRQDMAAHSVRIYPGYRWIVIETPAESASASTAAIARDPGAKPQRQSSFYGTDGTLAWESKGTVAPAPLGRDFVLACRSAAGDSTAPRLSVLRLPGGDALATWPGRAGWGASSPLGNFLAVNTIGVFDSTLGARQDELRLLDLEGKILYARTLTADSREFAVSNFGDVAIARERELLVLDRLGAERLRTPLPRNSVGRAAITPDGRFVLVASSSPLARRKGTGPWIALYEIARKTVVWSRRTLNLDAAKGAEVTELSLSDDGGRALARLSTGAVLLLGSDGRRLVAWNLERVSRGEYDPGNVPRRTWLSGDGTLVAFTMPVAGSLPEARGWLYRVAR